MALLVHLLLIAAIFLIHEKPPQMDLQSPPGIDVEFENNGTGPQTTVPPKTLKGPSQQAQAAPTPPPPPPSSAAASTSQDEVQVPDMPLSALSAPTPQPKPQPHPSHAHVAHPSHAQTQKYVFLNGMSYGNVSPVAPPTPARPHGMNFSPPMSDSQAATASDFSIKGNAGAGWDAALTKWVDEHAYYPQAAIEQNQQGTAVVEFTVDRFGHVTNIKLLDSSGSPFLDQAWFQLFADNKLPPFPPGAKSDHVVVRYTVHYQLVP